MRLAEPTPVTLDGVEGFFSMLLMVGMVAYLMGGSQAVIGGALIAYRVLHTGSVGYGFTVLVAVLVALASALYLGVVGGFKADVLSIGMLLLSSAVLEALLGRWLAGLLVLARDR